MFGLGKFIELMELLLAVIMVVSIYVCFFFLYSHQLRVLEV